MRRSLLCLLATTIVAAFQGHLAAAVAVSEDVPVTGGRAAVARALGVDPPPERARFIAELTRFAYKIPEGRRADVRPPVQLSEQPAGAPVGDAATVEAVELVPVPLTSAVWSDAVFRRRVAPSALVAAILSDRQAALLCHGLAGLDDESLQYLIEHPAVITDLYQNTASAFAAFAGSLHIRSGGVVTPGGEAAVPLWETAVGEKVTRPDRFLRQLFDRGDGRLAYLYDGISQLDSPHAAFALGSWITGAPARADRFRALTAVTKGAYREWTIKVVPFSRPIYDIISLLARVRVANDGAPLPPASLALWSRVFESDDLPAAGAKWTPDTADHPVDAAWLAETIVSGDVHQRGDRLDQFSFGQRAFASAGDVNPSELLAALRAFGRYRMLALTLDRLGITKPAVYVAAARHAGRVALLDRRQGFTALAQLQGALALVVRMKLVRTIDLQRVEALVGSLLAVAVKEEGYRGGVLDWFEREIRPLLPKSDSVENGLIAQLAGVRGAGALPIRVEWEGERYHLDLAAAEDDRLRRSREKQNGPPLDLALDIMGVVRRLSAESASVADVTAAIAALKTVAAALPVRSGVAAVAPGSADPAREARETIDRVMAELGLVERSFDGRKAARIAEPLTPIADMIGADVLLSFAYVVDITDPDSTVLQVSNVTRRHDFGLAMDDDDVRTRIAWSMPKQEVAPGVPWHVTGSALGLDVALATLGLRRVDITRVTDAPKLTSNERQTFAVSVALMNPFMLADADRDAIADAIGRGRARVSSLTLQTVDALADDIALDGWRRRAMSWSLAQDPERTVSLFSLTEILYLGGPPPAAAIDQWGMAAVVSTGCLCTQMAAPGAWSNLTGRPQLGVLSTAVADLNLRVAVALRELGLPAGIARHVLSAAVQDYIDEVRPNDNDDWLTLVRAAQATSRERIEDYVAAVTADGPLLPDRPSDPPRR